MKQLYIGDKAAKIGAYITMFITLTIITIFLYIAMVSIIPLSFFYYFFLLETILIIISFWIIFEKASKPGWSALIPIYNLVVLLEIVEKPLWWILLLLIPVFNIFVTIVILNGLSKKFGKDELFTIGLVVLGFLFFPILAFGPSKYLFK